MNKQEYLSELKSHLASLPEEEQDDAVRFYDEYFEDAGIENEQQVISELGKPFALAKSIICEQSAYSKSKSYANYKASISANLGSLNTANSIEPDVEPDVMPQQPHTQYTAYGYDKNETPAPKQGSYEEYKENYGGSTGNDRASGSVYDESYKHDGEYRNIRSGGQDTAAFILFLLATIFVLVPIIFSIAATAFGFGISTVASAVGAIIAFVCIFVKTPAFIGPVLICLGLVCIFFPLTYFLAAKLLPAMIKWIIKTFNRLSGGNR